MKTKIVWDAFSVYYGRYVGTVEGKDKKSAMTAAKSLIDGRVRLVKVEVCPNCLRRFDNNPHI